MISDSAKTIRVLALDFNETIVDSGFALVQMHFRKCCAKLFHSQSVFFGYVP